MTDIALKYSDTSAPVEDGHHTILVQNHQDGTQTFQAVSGTEARDLLAVHAGGAAPAPEPIPEPDPAPDANVFNADDLAAALAAASAGDVFYLDGGDYGALTDIPNGVSIASANPANPAMFSILRANGAVDVTFENIFLKYTYSPGDKDFANRFSANDSVRVSFVGCTFEGDVDESGAGKGRGFQAQGTVDLLIEECTFRTFWKAMGVGGTNLVIRANDISRIRSDGINTGPCTNLLIELNYIHDFGTTEVSKDHRDMIQLMGEATGVVLRDNFLDMNEGLYAQAIWSDNKNLMTDVVIANNLILNAHTNGIALSNIVNLTVDANIMASVPRDVTTGIAIPKINVWAREGSVLAVASNTVPGIINPKNLDDLNIIEDGDDVALRMAARQDPRWERFFA